MPFLDPTLSLSTRQEAFCRHYTASGNAADAARRAGYAATLRKADRMRPAGTALDRGAGAAHPPVVAAHGDGTRRRSCWPVWNRSGMRRSPAGRPT